MQKMRKKAEMQKKKDVIINNYITCIFWQLAIESAAGKNETDSRGELITLVKSSITIVFCV